MSGTRVGHFLGMGQAVSRAVSRGERLAQELKLRLLNKEMHFIMSVPISFHSV